VIGFLLLLLGAAVIAYATALFASRFLIQVVPDRSFVVALLAVLVTLIALLVFFFAANALVKVKAPSAEMGGLSWLLETISYAVVIAVAVSCLVVGIARGLKKPTLEPN